MLIFTLGQVTIGKSSRGVQSAIADTQPTPELLHQLYTVLSACCVENGGCRRLNMLAKTSTINR